jgi:hypothetical protein
MIKTGSEFGFKEVEEFLQKRNLEDAHKSNAQVF